MYLRRCRGNKGKSNPVYWQLVESYRTERGPRQRVVAYLSDIPQALRLGIEQAATGQLGIYQPPLLGDDRQPEWVEVDVSRVRVERVCDFGGYWLGLQAAEKLELPAFLRSALPPGREDIPWSMMAMVLVLMRLCEPSSELHIAEHLYEQSALGDLLGIPLDKVNDDRLYRTLDSLLPYKAKLEKHLKERLGELFGLQYDLLLYDITSTYFEGEVADNEQAKRGYSRDHRPDCKQVCIALVVSRCGMPLGYEVFDGNRADVTTVKEIVKQIESQYGRADRIWVMDRGMVSEENLRFLRSDGRRYIIGTARRQLKHFERELLGQDWHKIREGLEVKLCPGQEGEETFILCRSESRAMKEKAMLQRFEGNIEAGLVKLAKGCEEQKRKMSVVERRVGALLGANTRARGLFKVEVRAGEDGGARVVWEKVESRRQWAELSQGCYVLRSNIVDWDAEGLWQAYIQLTEAEAAFRVQKDDLGIRPIWHQKKERVHSHILVCFLAYVLWRTIGQLCHRAGLGSEPRQVFAEVSRIKVVDVILPTRIGVDIRKRCVSEPTDHQAVLLDRLQMGLPGSLNVRKM